MRAISSTSDPAADILIIGAGSTGLAVLESTLAILEVRGNAAKPTRITLLDDECFKRMSDAELDAHVARASKASAELSVVQGSAIDMQEQSSSSSSSTFSIITADHNFVHAKQVVLALGRAFTRDSDFEHLSWAPKYIAPQERRPVPGSATVGIAGSNMRAVTEVLRLLSAGHSGKILMVSKTGKLPRVRREDVVEKRFPNWKLSVLARKLQLKPIKGNLRLIREALRDEATAQGVDYDKLASQPAEALEALRADIVSNAPWAPLFASFWNLLPDFWRSLSEDEIEEEREDEERWQFEHDFLPTSPAFLEAIPMSDATRLETAMAAGQVSVVRYENIDAVVPEGASREDFLISLEGGDARAKTKVDYFVDVAVPETKLSWIKSQSPLLSNLVRRGLVEEHYRGGVEVNFNTLAARPRLHVVGSLTDGVHFRTTPEHSKSIAYSLLKMRRPRDRLHIAIFLGPDLLSNIMASQVIPQILKAGHLPFMYQIIDQDDLFQVPRLDFGVKEYLAYDRTLLRGYAFPAIGTGGGGSGTNALLPPDGLKARYGICVQDMNAHGQAAAQTLMAHLIDLGIILQPSRVVPHAFVRSIEAHFTSNNTTINATAADLWTLAPGWRHDNSIPALLAMRRGDSTMSITLEETLTMRTISTSKTRIDRDASVLRNSVAVHGVGAEMLLANISSFAQDTIAGAASTPDRRSEAKSRAPSTHEVDEAFMRGIKLVEREDVVAIVSDLYGSAELRDAVRMAVYSIAMRIHGQRVKMEQDEAKLAKSEDDDGGCLRWLGACIGLC